MSVSLVRLRVLVGTFVVITITSVALAINAVSKGVALSRLDRLDRRNELLATELARAHELVELVSDSIQVISERDRRVRLLSGLEPTDPEVQQAGIGGPLGASSERELILSETEEGLQALEMSMQLSSLVRRANLLASSFDAAAESLATQKTLLERTPSIWPTQGYLASRYSRSRMHPIHHEARAHLGIDISAPMGAPIRASAAGYVQDVNKSRGYGTMIVVNHGRGVVTRYAHCSKSTVKIGQRVKRGDKIGEVGKSGIATAPHLHYEVIVNGKTMDPRSWIFGDGEVSF